MKRLAIIALSLATTLTTTLATTLAGAPPAAAFPVMTAPDIGARQAEPVRYRGGYHGGYYRHHGGDGWGWALGGLATGVIIGGLLSQPRYYGSGYYDRGYYGTGYYGSAYYGPRYYAPRYYAPRTYRPAYYGGNAHVRWCFARYRSYRAYDNTFQPYYGRRQACLSPYY
jgi:hypothetical protein